MEKNIDWKKIWLLYWEKVWLLIAIILFSVLLAAGGYRVARALTDGEQLYLVSSDYYITFNDKDYPEGVDYYNAYTWDTILRDDPLVEEALNHLPDDYTKEELRDSVTGEMLGDYRILTVYSKHTDPKRSQAIADAYEISLARFADKINMLSTIEVWSQEECVPVVEKDLTANAAIIGAMIGVIAAVFFCVIHSVLDDSIYLENDLAERFDIPFLGMMTKEKSDLCKQELKENLSYLLREKEGYHLVFLPINMETEKHKESEKQAGLTAEVKELNSNVEGILTWQGEDLRKLRQSNGAILMIPWGSKNGNMVQKAITFLQNQDCPLAGAVLYDADDKFIRKYYNRKKK